MPEVKQKQKEVLASLPDRMGVGLLQIMDSVLQARSDFSENKQYRRYLVGVK
jgi:hypothetical protein